MQTIDNLKAVKASGVQLKSHSMTETSRGFAWSCNVYLNGKKLGMVSDQGDGGMIHIDFGADQQKQVVSLLKQHGYKLELTFGDTTIDEPTTDDAWLGFAIGQIGDEMAEVKTYKRKAKTGVYFEKKTAPTLAFIKGEDTPRRREQIKARCADFVGFLVGYLSEEIAEL